MTGNTPDSIAFELAGVGDPSDLAASIEGSVATGHDPEDPPSGNPEVASQG
jgi:hypothetical protein